MDINHEKGTKEFFTEIEGKKAYVSYEIHDGGLDIIHTIVPDELGGRGIAAELVQTAYDYAKTEGLKPIATCPYAVRWLEKHPEYR